MTRKIDKHMVWAAVTMAAAIAVGVSGLVFCLKMAKSEVNTSHVDWVETARNQPLQPCFKNHIHARVQYHNSLKQEDLSSEELAEYSEAGQIIPEGPHEGVIVPERCFAVADGYYGFTVTFWERPKDADRHFDMSIPFWTGPEGSLAPVASTDDQG